MVVVRDPYFIPSYLRIKLRPVEIRRNIKRAVKTLNSSTFQNTVQEKLEHFKIQFQNSGHFKKQPKLWVQNIKIS